MCVKPRWASRDAQVQWDAIARGLKRKKVYRATCAIHIRQRRKGPCLWLDKFKLRKASLHNLQRRDSRADLSLQHPREDGRTFQISSPRKGRTGASRKGPCGQSGLKTKIPLENHCSRAGSEGFVCCTPWQKATQPRPCCWGKEKCQGDETLK